MEQEQFKVQVEQVPRRKRPSLRSQPRNPLVDDAVSRILGDKPKVTVAAFQSSI